MPPQRHFGMIQGTILLLPPPSGALPSHQDTRRTEKSHSCTRANPRQETLKWLGVIRRAASHWSGSSSSSRLPGWVLMRSKMSRR